MSEPDAVPLPREGEVFFDVRGESRCMRLSWYADSAVAVFSIWQGNRCTGTFRLPFHDLDRMVRALQSGPARPAVTGRPDAGYLDRDPAQAYSGVHGHRQSPAGQHFYQAEPGYGPERPAEPWYEPERPAEPWYEPERPAEPAFAGPGFPAGPVFAGPEHQAETWHGGPGYPADPWYADSWQTDPPSAARYAGP